MDAGMLTWLLILSPALVTALLLAVLIAADLALRWRR